MGRWRGGCEGEGVEFVWLVGGVPVASRRRFVSSPSLAVSLRRLTPSPAERGREGERREGEREGGREGGRERYMYMYKCTVLICQSLDSLLPLPPSPSLPFFPSVITRGMLREGSGYMRPGSWAKEA